MKIENSFTIDASIEQVWATLTDIEQLAHCLPGAKLAGEQDGAYTGGLTIKMGPVAAQYRGSAEFIERDEVNHRAVLDSKGRDSRGAGNAQARITAQLAAVGDKTEVEISTDLEVTGKVAQFGRGVVQEVSEKFVRQFADCVAATVADSSAEGAVGDGASARPAAKEREEQDGAGRTNDPENQQLDLIKVAGVAVSKRLIPVACVAVIVVVALLVIL